MREILGLATHHRYAVSHTITHQGDAAERLYLLTSGNALQSVKTNAPERIVRGIRPGYVFGAMSLLEDLPDEADSRYVASTRILQTGCTASWDRETMNGLLEKYPQLRSRALKIASYIAEDLTARIISLASQDAPHRVAALIVTLAKDIGNETTHGIKIDNVTVKDIANAVNMPPHTASRCIAPWQREGIMRRTYNKVFLYEPSTLNRIAQS
jgi:CRP-like cAMP-binding protein